MYIAQSKLLGRMKTFAKTTFTVLFIAIVIYACTSKKGELPEPKPAIVITDTVKYGRDVAPIIQTYCASAGCHAEGVQVPYLTTYSEVKASAGRIYIRAITIGDMPQYGSTALPELEKAKLKKWLEDGALNN